MTTKPQTPLGSGIIVWLGINSERGKFSVPHDSVLITDYGIETDMYCSIERRLSSHDGEYIVTDGLAHGDRVANDRQITIVDRGELTIASTRANIDIQPGMLRENIHIDYKPSEGTALFSKIQPNSRMVIDTGNGERKVLILTEENGPCKTTTRPISNHFDQNAEFDEVLRNKHLDGRRGQMARVKTLANQRVFVGMTFIIYPPLG